MTSIVANIKDSLGNPLANGVIRVSLTYDLLTASTNYLTVPAEIVLDGTGSATFTLAPSEVDNVAYKFEIFTRTGAPGSYIYIPVREAFYATIPDQAGPLSFAELVPTGIGQDALDTSFTAIVRRLSSSEDFWNRLTDELVNPRGTYDPLAYYSRGDTVFFQGWSFLYTYPLVTQAPAPVLGTQTVYWAPWAARGETGAGTTGSNAAYDAGAWVGSSTAVSQQSLHSMVGTVLARQSSVTGFANAIDGTLTRPVLAGNPTSGDNSLLVPSTSWVKAITDELAKAICPIGTLAGFAGTSAPARWVLCDGRTVSRTTYASLFAVVGTTYNTGGEAGADFRLPDLRGRTIAGPDNMSALHGSANRLTSNGVLGASGGSETTAITYVNLPTYPSGDEFANQGTQAGGAFANRVMVTRQGSTATPLPNLPPYQVANWIVYAGV